MHPDESGAPPPRGPALADYYARFPGPMAVAQEEVGLGPMTSWGQTGVDSIVSSLEVLYELDNRYLLAVNCVAERQANRQASLTTEDNAYNGWNPGAYSTNVDFVFDGQ